VTASVPGLARQLAGHDQPADVGDEGVRALGGVPLPDEDRGAERADDEEDRAGRGLDAEERQGELLERRDPRREEDGREGLDRAGEEPDDRAASGLTTPRSPRPS
jgi:hypothetical protein